MVVRFQVLVECIDEESQKVIGRKTIHDKIIQPIKTIMELGFRHNEQIKIIQKIQDSLLENQSNLLQEDISHCPECGIKLQRHGFKKSEFHSVFTDHTVGVRRMKKLGRKRPSFKTASAAAAYPFFQIYPFQ